MKRIVTGLLLLCVLLVAAYGLACYWIGTEAQKQYDTLLAQSTQPNVEIIGRSYERGLFHSSAVTTLAVKVPGEKKEAVFRATLVNSIQHGPLASVKNSDVDKSFQPVLAVITTRLAPEQEQGELLRAALGKLPELGSSEMITFLNFDGTGESSLNIPAFKKKVTIEGKEELQVNWDGLKTKSKFDIANSTISGSFSAPRLEAGNSEAGFSALDVKGDFSTYPGIKGVLLGALNFFCKRIELHSKEDNLRALVESTTVQAESVVSGDTVSCSLTTRFDRAAIDEEGYGPFAFELEFRRLEPEAIARFQQDMKEVQSRFAGTSDEDIQAIMAACYKRLLQRLLAKSPEVEIKQLKMSTPKGDLSGKLKITVADTGGSLLENPLLALNSIGIDLKGQISEPLLLYWMESAFKGDFEGKGELGNGGDPGKSVPSDPEQAGKLAAEKASSTIARLLQQNMIVRENGSIKTRASYSTGHLTINGKTRSLADLLAQ